MTSISLFRALRIQEMGLGAEPNKEAKLIHTLFSVQYNAIVTPEVVFGAPDRFRRILEDQIPRLLCLISSFMDPLNQFFCKLKSRRAHIVSTRGNHQPPFPFNAFDTKPR